MTDIETLMSQGWELSYDSELKPELHKPAPLPDYPDAYMRLYLPDSGTALPVPPGLWRAVMCSRATGSVVRYMLDVKDNSCLISLARSAERSYAS